jgi:ribosomal protein L11 methyltransferase
VKTSPALDIHFPAEESTAARLIGRLDDLSPVAIHELGPDEATMWRAFFKDAAARDNAAHALASDFGDRLRCESIDIADEDWAARSQSALRAVRVGRLVVAPPWDAAAGSRHQAPGSGLEAQGEEFVIVIQPSMGFGTGHHETTRLCLELLQSIDLSGRDVLDVGTGSGVLAIAAALLGARHVRAVDIDEDALSSARENVALNHDALVASATTIDVVTGNVRDGFPASDLVLANLTGGLLVSSAAALRAAVTPGGSLLVSGFQPHEADDVLRALASDSAVVERRRDGEWEAALIRV